MRKKWKSKPLGEVATFLNGLWKGKRPPYVTAGVIRNANFKKDGSIDDSNIAWLEIEAKQFEKRKLKAGDIILEKSGGGPKQAVGRVVLFEKKKGDYSFSNFTSAIRVADKNELDFRFLHKFLFFKYASGATEAMQRHSTGIRNLNAAAYREIAVPLPPLSEQQRIVAILDEAFAGLTTATANAEKNLKNARELFASHLNSIFSKKGEDWTDATINNLCTFENGDRGKNYPSRSTRTTKGIPFINAGHLTEDGIDLERLDFIPRERFDLLSNGKIRKGDILFCLRGSLGKYASVGDLEEGAIASSLVIVRANEGVSQDFLPLYFGSRMCADMIAKFGNGAAQPNLSARSLGEFEISVPPASEQNRIVEECGHLRDQTKGLSLNYQTKLDELAKLKQSILQKAFSGELTSPPSQAIKEAAE